MSDNIFLDTNVLIYLYSTEKDKQHVVLSLLESDKMFCISTHIIMEFCNVLIKKLKYSRDKVDIALEDFKENFEIIEVDFQIIKDALRIQERYQYSFFDSLVLATAPSSDCTHVYSDDMQQSTD